MHKKTKIITGIISFAYFSIPYIIDNVSWKPASFFAYAITFVPIYIYNGLYNHGHVLAFMGLMAAAVLLWIWIYLVLKETYEIFLDIYLNKERFKDKRSKRIKAE